MNYPVSEHVEEQSGPRSFDSNGRCISLLTGPFNRSVSELALRGDTGTVRPRANSLQDDRRFKSPSREPTLADHIATRSLPIPRTMPFLFGGLELGKPLNVEASPFIPSPGMTTPPSERSDDVTTTISCPSPDLSLATRPAEESPSPPLRFGRRGSVSSTSSICSTPSTVKPDVAPATVTAASEPPTKHRFTKAERRAVETVINVLLETKSKGDTRVSSRSLPRLILVKDRSVYKGVGSRGNRYRKLIDLGVQMGWLEVGPENAWVDVGKGWSEEASS